MDHRRADALAQLGEVGPQRHLVDLGSGELPLKGGDGHDPAVGVDEIALDLRRSRRPSALHQDAGDNLQAVGHAVLEFLEQDRLLVQQVVLEPRRQARLGHIGDRQHQPDVGRVPVVECVSGDHQASLTTSGPGEIHLVGVDLRSAGPGRAKQRPQLRHIPLAIAEAEHGTTVDGRGVELEDTGEGCARRNDVQFAIEKDDRGVGGRDESQRQAVCNSWSCGTVVCHF